MKDSADAMQEPPHNEPNKAVEDDGDKRVFFGLRDLSRSLR